MSEAGSTTGARRADDPAWAPDSEIPDADAEEQRRAVLDDPEDVDPETVAGRDRGDQLAEPPLEVSEADLVDQLVDLPFDEDADRS